MNKELAITITAAVNAPVETVWKKWNTPEDITQWAFAAPDWCCPSATNDLKVGGKFTTRMEARDKSMGFDLHGIYTEVEELKKIAYTMSDGRKVEIVFVANGNMTTVTETFEAENENPKDLQQMGWQAILNNFKAHCEKV